MDDFLDRPGGDGTYVDLENREVPFSQFFAESRRATGVSAQNQGVSTQALKDWDSFAAADRNSLFLAIRRLSASLSRSGSLAGQDRILDISIALEILYKLSGGEITYKLATRAGWYLGNEACERLRIKKTLSDFYGFRSAIVHGRRVKKSGDEVRKQAFDIARKTLLRHLANGNMPDDQHWSGIVMGGENQDKR